MILVHTCIEVKGKRRETGGKITGSAGVSGKL